MWSQPCTPTSCPASPTERITLASFCPIIGAGSSVPYIIVRLGYIAAALDRSIFFRNPFRVNTRAIARPDRSGPRVK